MVKENTRHDSLFKWLVTTFAREYFLHYFPEQTIGEIHFVDKEFISKYEAFSDSLEGDLLVAMEVDFEGVRHNIIVCIEHKSKREDVALAVMRYMAYAWLLWERPVWTIVMFTDDSLWRKEMRNEYWYGFSQSVGKQHYKYDIIKVNRELSRDLIAEGSLFTSLLALKADTRECRREAIIEAIYRNGAAMGDRLSDEHKLLMEQWVGAYGGVPKAVVQSIKEKTHMGIVATTITEYYELIGEKHEIERTIESYHRLYQTGALAEPAYLQEVGKLQLRLAKLDAIRDIS